MKPILALLAAATIVLTGYAGAQAQSALTVLSPNPIKETLDRLVTNFEAKTGTKVVVTYGTGVGTRKTVASGGALDVTLLFAPFEDAIKTGNVVPGSATVVARLRLAMAVKKGTPKPDIATVAAAKSALLNTKSIVAVDPAQGSAGGAVVLALNKMGITDAVESKIKWVPNGGDVQRSVARGETELALGPYLSDMRNPGIDVLGALPPEAATPVDITGFLSTGVKDANAARALLAYLRSEEAAPFWREEKIFPVQ